MMNSTTRPTEPATQTVQTGKAAKAAAQLRRKLDTAKEAAAEARRQAREAQRELEKALEQQRAEDALLIVTHFSAQRRTQGDPIPEDLDSQLQYWKQRLKIS